MRWNWSAFQHVTRVWGPECGRGLYVVESYKKRYAVVADGALEAIDDVLLAAFGIEPRRGFKLTSLGEER
jgi:hypothetical protein